ncbi:hypothetical protein HK100_010515, partial [Physocladia obscura]
MIAIAADNYLSNTKVLTRKASIPIKSGATIANVIASSKFRKPESLTLSNTLTSVDVRSDKVSRLEVISSRRGMNTAADVTGGTGAGRSNDFNSFDIRHSLTGIGGSGSGRIGSSSSDLASGYTVSRPGLKKCAGMPSGALRKEGDIVARQKKDIGKIINFLSTTANEFDGKEGCLIDVNLVISKNSAFLLEMESPTGKNILSIED